MFRFGCGRHYNSIRYTFNKNNDSLIKILVKLLTVTVIVLKSKSSPIRGSAQHYWSFEPDSKRKIAFRWLTPGDFLRFRCYMSST